MNSFVRTFVVVCLCFLVFPARAQDTTTNAVTMTKERQEIKSLVAAGKLDEALTLAQRWVLTNETLYGVESTNTAIALAWVAAVYSQMGDWAKAEPLCQRVLTITEKELGPEHPETLMAVN